MSVFTVGPIYLFALGIGFILLGFGLGLADFIRVEDHLAMVRIVPILNGIAVLLFVFAKKLNKKMRVFHITTIVLGVACLLFSLWYLF